MKHVGYIAGTGNIIYPLRENDKEEEREEPRVILCISKPEQEPEEPTEIKERWVFDKNGVGRREK